MKTAIVLVCLIIGFFTSECVSAQNYVRSYVRARSSGDTQTMNRITSEIRRPYSSLQRGYYGQNNLAIRIYSNRRPLATSLDRPTRTNIYRNYYSRGYPLGRVDIYVPGRR